MSFEKRKWTEEEVRRWYQDTGEVTYSNPNDRNVIVPGPSGNKLTVNWANPKAYLVIAGLLAVLLILCFNRDL